MRIITDKGEEHYAIKLVFKTIKNEAKYEALFLGMTIAKSLGAKEVEFKANSQVVVNQVRGEFVENGKKLKKHLALIQGEHTHFQYFQIQQIPTIENNKADRLVKTASRQEAAPMSESAVHKTIEVPVVGVELLEVGSGARKWVQDILRYLNDNKFPGSKEGPRKVRYQAVTYTIVDRVLYGRGYSAPLLR